MTNRPSPCPDTHQVPALPARLRVPAPPAAVEPRQPGRRWPDARSAAPLLGRRVQTCEGQPTLTELTGLTRENEKEEKHKKDQHRGASSKQAITFWPVSRSKRFFIPSVRTQFKPDPSRFFKGGRKDIFEPVIHEWKD